MTSNMSGLASLALAIDRLDQQQQHLSSPTTVQTSFADTSVDTKPSPPPPSHSWDSGASRIPQKQSYSLETTRAVSVGSLETEDRHQHQVNITTNANAVTPHMNTTPTEDVVELVLDDSTENPPPSPPAPDEVIDRVQDDDVLCGKYV